VVAAARRGGAHFSITARMDPAIRRAIASIPEEAWVAIQYPQAIWDEDEGRWIFDAEVAEIPVTAFTSRRKAEHISARLIVRRVRRLNPTSVPAGQSELFAAYRHHALFTDSPLPMLAAEAGHRDHAIVEQVIADLKSGPLAHMPSGRFAANSAWTVLAAVAFNLTRAAGAVASAFHAKATTATIRAQPIAVPARIARSARRLRLHLPRHWPWETAWTQLFTSACGPPGALAS
jgi:DDE family transposase